MAIPVTSERYELVRRIRIASTFQSYEAAHPKKPGRFMLDVFTGMDLGAERPRAFLRDAAKVSSLRHPHILQMLELSALPDGTPIVVSELPPGQTLKAWLDAGHVPSVRTVVRWIGALAEAVDAAHGAGVVHGAIGPNNVFLVRGSRDGLGLPKLKGFGLEWLRAPAPGGLRAAEPASASSGMSGVGEAVPAPTDERFPGVGDRAGTAGGVALDLAALARLAQRLLLPRSQQPASGLDVPEALRWPVRAVLARASDHVGDAPFESASELAEALEAAALGLPLDPDLSDGERSSPKGIRRRTIGRVWPSATLIALTGAAMFIGVGTSTLLEARYFREAAASTGGGGGRRAPGGRESTLAHPPPAARPSSTMIPTTSLWPPPLLHAPLLQAPLLHAPSLNAPSPTTVALAPASATESAVVDPSSATHGPVQHSHGRHGVVWSPGLGRLAEVVEVSTAFGGDRRPRMAPAALEKSGFSP